MQNQQKENGLKWLWLTVVVFIADIASKFIILSLFDYPGDSYPIFSFFAITYAQNIGAAFSILSGQRWALSAIAIITSGVIIYLLYKNPKNDYFGNCGLALVLGGAIGNLFDRLYHGFVVDFFDVYLGSWRYPTFNIADMAICAGVGLFILSSLKSSSHDKKSTEKTGIKS